MICSKMPKAFNGRVVVKCHKDFWLVLSDLRSVSMRGVFLCQAFRPVKWFDSVILTSMDKDTIAGFFLEGWYVFDNFAPFQIEWRGKLYPTSEHAYQAAHFTDSAPHIAEEVRLCRSPKLASDLANSNAAMEDPGWKSKRLALMEEILRCKLDQHDLIRDTLISSETKTIIEMNDNDAFWGWGADHNGENNLGKIWMKLRDEIISSPDKS